MRKWLLAASILSLFASLTACAHRNAAYGYGVGGVFPEGCEFDEECYAGPQYTCVFYQPPAAPARLEIALARPHGSPRVIGPREGLAGGSPGPSAPSVTSSMPPSPPPVARAPVVLSSPPSGGRAPQSRD